MRTSHPYFSQICNRLAPYCEAWTVPPIKIPNPTKANTGCELYFHPDTPDDEIPRSWILGDLNVTFAPQKLDRRRLKQQKKKQPPLPEMEMNFGRPHGAEPQYFLGCGWSYWFTLDFPCLSGELDDKVFLLNDTFTVSSPPRVSNASSSDPLPLCGADAELLANSWGRWVQEPFPDDDECLAPFEVDNNFSSRYEMIMYNGERPHCWHRDAIDRIGLRCVERNCALIDMSRYWSSRGRVSRWMGVWREYSCDYLEFTDKELQQCIDVKKISQIDVKGASIAGNLKVMVDQRLQPLTMYPNASDPESIEVTVATLSLLHKSMESESMVRKSLRLLNDATDQKPIYIYNGYYTSSEREPYTHAERTFDLSRIFEEELIPKGYRQLNVYGMSTAWAFDADGQRDGMHIIGPPMRMGVTKLFHHLCGDVVAGRRV